MKLEANFTVDGIHIKDRAGRVVTFRGCNLGGDSKIPFSPEGNPLSYDVSFTGRPFPEAEADAHYARLAAWGFNLVRFVITWEAVEHAGPGIYDEDYLAYLRNVVKKAEDHGISVFVDPHQDVWSRWTGGDGAPGWTLEAVGFDLSRIETVGAAFTTQGQGDSYREMTWGMNYLRYANATMWTLFFGGNVFAPGRYVDGVPIQDWLQDHYIDAMKHTARRLKDCAGIVGFGTLNEPHAGFIGLDDLNSHHRVTSREGPVPTAMQAIAAASGFPQKTKRVLFAGVIRLPGKETLNPTGVSLFRSGFECPWREAGVWDAVDGTPRAVKPSWFGIAPDGHHYDFANEFLKPFQLKFMRALFPKHQQYLFFVEGVPMAERPSWKPGELVSEDGKPLAVVEAFHWYDGLTLLFKRWHTWVMADGENGTLSVGLGASRKSAARQLSRLAKMPREESIPALIGEFGVQFDLRDGRAFRTGDYSEQEEALTTYYDAIDASMLSSTIWNYSASNTHEAGDGWNTEDLSIYSATTGEGRAVRGFCRPYAMAVAGTPVSARFDAKRRTFAFEWDATPAEGEAGLSEFFVPSVWYPEGWRAEFAGEGAELEELPEAQRLTVRVSSQARARVTVRPLGRDER